MFKAFFKGRLQQGMLLGYVILIGYIGYLKYANTVLDNSVLEGELSITNLTNEFDKCTENLKNINKKILVAKKNSDKYQESIEELEIDIARKEGENKALIDGIRDIDAPDNCSEYGDYLRDGLEKIKW